MKYVKTQQTTVEAIKYQADLGNNRVMNWLAQQGVNLKGWVFNDGEIVVPTKNGKLYARDGHWLVNDPVDGFYVYPNTTFTAAYKEVSEQTYKSLSGHSYLTPHEVNVAGHSKPLYVTGYNSRCGHIHNGVAFQFDQEGSWVVAVDVLDGIVKRARDVQARDNR